MIDERRLTTRAAVDWPAEASLAEGARAPVRVINASIGGLQVEADRPLGSITGVHLVVDLPNGAVELTVGVVPAWALRRGEGVLAGLRFLPLSAGDQERLKAILSHCLGL